MLCLVASKHKHIGYPEEIQVDQCVFGLYFGESAANEMRHCRDAVFLLYCRGNCYCARTASLAHFLIKAVGGVFIHHLASVSGDVDVERVELPEHVNVFEQLRDAFAFKRGEHLK